MPPSESGNGIHAPWMPGMALADPENTERHPLAYPVPKQRFPGILRTARVEPASLTQERADRQLVGADHARQDPFHPLFHRSAMRSSSSRISALASPHCAGPGNCLNRMTTSTRPRVGARPRNDSRTKRLIRLRSTARAATRLVIARPSRARSQAELTT